MNPQCNVEWCRYCEKGECRHGSPDLVHSSGDAGSQPVLICTSAEEKKDYE